MVRDPACTCYKFNIVFASPFMFVVAETPRGDAGSGLGNLTPK
jgi:hypothetical protein